ncbi:MAG TPA: HAD family hydrolase [Anaerolineae bacterium]|nr:HAD family hydrolase [Anaerolineae bacterium]
MKAVLFDLDDTLYPEIEFVKSGFRAVACHLSSRYHLNEDTLFTKMLEILQRDGRGRVFDTLLCDLGMYAEEKVRLLVYLYRSHCPTIHPYEDALPMISRLKEGGLHLGVITDGMASVQRGKVKALGLGELFDVIIYTDEVGREYWKPSVIPYQVALDLLRVEPSEAAYVGNDLGKDFLGANALGMLAIQVKRSMQQDCVQTESVEPSAPRFVVNKLNKVLHIVEEKCDV